MEYKCPECGGTSFEMAVSVRQYWTVDKYGVKDRCIDTSGPFNEKWTCSVCGHEGEKNDFAMRECLEYEDGCVFVRAEIIEENGSEITLLPFFAVVSDDCMHATPEFFTEPFKVTILREFIDEHRGTKTLYVQYNDTGETAFLDAAKRCFFSPSEMKEFREEELKAAKEKEDLLKGKEDKKEDISDG